MDAERAKKEASTRSTIRPPRRRVDQVEREKQHSTHRQARRLFFPAFRAETLASWQTRGRTPFFPFRFAPQTPFARFLPNVHGFVFRPAWFRESTYAFGSEAKGFFA